MMYHLWSALAQPGIELTDDPRFARRIRRLAFTSAIVLGLFVVLWALTLDAHPATGIGLALGWALMPTILWTSLRRPQLRYALVLPSSLVSVSLIVISITARPGSSLAAGGWLMITTGVLLGGLLGIWFWFRLLPVPVALHDPFSPTRWLLVGLHIGLTVTGLLLVVLTL
jgi:hypothetical protein